MTFFWIITLAVIVLPVGTKIIRAIQRLIWECQKVKRNTRREAELDLTRTIEQKRDLQVESQDAESQKAGWSDNRKAGQEFNFEKWIKQERKLETYLPDPFSRIPGEDDDPGIEHSEKEIEREIQALASTLLAQARDESKAAADFLRLVLSHGGIARYRNGYMSEEYDRNVPKWYRRKNGLAPDQIAQEMGFDSDGELYRAIAGYEAMRKQKSLKLNYFLDKAAVTVCKQIGTSYEGIDLEAVPF